MIIIRLSVLVLTSVLTAGGTLAQTDRSTLTLDRLFNSEDFISERFGPARWLADGSGYTTVEPAPGGPGREIVRYDPSSGRREVIIPASRLIPQGRSVPLEIDDYAWSPDGRRLLVFTNSQRVWRENTRGDYWVLDLDDGRLVQLGGDAEASSLMFAKFSPDGGRVAYVLMNDLYVESLLDHAIVRLTERASPHVINGTFDWVYEEELGLRDGYRWSPDGRSIAYWQLDTTGVREFQLINNTAGLYPTITSIPYPKAGQTNSSARVGVVATRGGATRWLDLPGDPRNHYIARMSWAAGSEQLVLQRLNRLQNRNEVLLADAQSGAIRVVLTERDQAWTDVVDQLQWLDGGREFLWTSERGGWRQVYAVARAAGQLRLVTPDAFDVIGLELVDEDAGWLYYIASPDDPTRRYLYRRRLDGTAEADRITPVDEPGTHSYQISPDGRWAFHTYSTFETPPRIDLIRLPSHEVVRSVAANADLRQRVADLERYPVEFFRVGGDDGVELDGWLMRPPRFDPDRQYPLLFYVYGEPAGQTVLDRWSGGRYLWHLFLAQRGYLVASVDNRGTPAPRGRAWRKSIYGQVGILASRDQAEAARRIRAWPFVDPERVGIWGWSGGGSMTLNMLFRYPELYHVGMSVAPVPDQRYYDTIYQERYMGLPQDNAEGYREGSPITHVDGLRGELLLVHGTGDDNVHYQGSEALIDALVERNKPFTMMAYPNRSHGISEGPGTQRHLFELLTRFLETHLTPGPKSGAQPGGP